MNGAAVDPSKSHSNVKAQVSALEALLGKLPDVSAPVVQRERRATPRTARQIKGDQALTLIAAYEDGATLADLSRRYGISKQTVSSILKRHGIEPRWSRRITDEEVDEAVRLYEQGMSLAQVGNRLGFDANTIHAHLLKRGVKMRDKHGRVK